MEKDNASQAETLFFDLLKRENKALIQLQAAEDALMLRYNAASDPDSDDLTVEEFSRWLGVGRREIEQARARLSDITLERGLVRQALTTKLSAGKDHKGHFSQ